MECLKVFWNPSNYVERAYQVFGTLSHRSLWIFMASDICTRWRDVGRGALASASVISLPFVYYGGFGLAALNLYSKIFFLCASGEAFATVTEARSQNEMSRLRALANRVNVQHIRVRRER